MRLGIIIPVYQASESLEGLLANLQLQQFSNFEDVALIVVNDGSTRSESHEILAKISKYSRTTIIDHEKNLGKGAALKSGIAHANKIGLDFVVVADADGQHTANDIQKVASHSKYVDGFVIGSRSFDVDVPLRSKVGNTLTRLLFRFIFSKNLSDTQSGLRAFPARIFPEMLSIPQNRYEYEFQTLVTISQKRNIYQIPIETVYESGNPSSHFRPIIDSALIYFIFIRYTFSVLLVACCDILGFLFLSKLIEPAMAFGIVRTLSVVAYFVVVKKIVFKAKGNLLSQSLKFICLVLFNLALVGFLAFAAQKYFAIAPSSIYFISTLILFGFNFTVQRYVIFRT